MKKYRVMIWTSVDVEALDETQASDIAEEMFIDGLIRNRDFSFEPEEFFPSEYGESNE